MTATIACSKMILAQGLGLVIDHLSWKVEEVISNGHPDTPKAATLARLAAQEALASQDWQEASVFLEAALAAVRAQTAPWREEILRSLFDLFLLRFKHGTVDKTLELVDEMVSLIEALDTQNGRPLLGKADLLHIKAYLLSTQGRNDEAIWEMAGCLPIRKKHLPKNSQLIALNERAFTALCS